MIEDVRNKRKPGDTGAMLAACPHCLGEGRVRKELPLGANPKAPATHVERMGWRPCPRCSGSGQIGVG